MLDPLKGLHYAAHCLNSSTTKSVLIVFSRDIHCPGSDVRRPNVRNVCIEAPRCSAFYSYNWAYLIDVTRNVSCSLSL